MKASGLGARCIYQLVTLSTYAVIVVVEEVPTFFQLIGHGGASWSHPTLLELTADNYVAALQLLLPYMLSKILRGEPYTVILLWPIVNRVLMSISMYFFVKKYIVYLTSNRSSIGLFIAAYTSGLIYSHLPYNIYADIPSALNFTAAMLPFFLTFCLIIVRNRSISGWFWASILLFVIAASDPRVGLWSVIISFFVCFPFIVREPRSCFALCLSYLAATIPSLIYAFGQKLLLIKTQGSAASIPLTRSAFIWSSFPQIVTGDGLQYQQLPALLSIFIFNLPILVGFSLLCSGKFRKSIARAILSLVGLYLLSVVPFLSPPLRNSLLEFLLSLNPSNSFVSTAIVSFRTTRFTDFVLGITYSLLPALALWFLIQSKGRIFKLLTISVFIFLLVGNIVSFSFTMVENGGQSFVVTGNFPESRFRDYGDLWSNISNALNEQQVWVVPQEYEVYSLSGLKNYIMGTGIERYVYAYAIDPFTSPLVKSPSVLNANISAYIMRSLGIRYLVVDQYLKGASSVLAFVQLSPNFVYQGRIGSLSVYWVQGATGTWAPDLLVGVVGGLNTFYSSLPYLQSVLNSSGIVPLFYDSPVTNVRPNLTIASGLNSAFDFVLPQLVRNGSALMVPLTQYLAPTQNWRPAYVTDTHHGVFTYSVPQDFDWQYSYDPSYGFAITTGGTLNLTVSYPKSWNSATILLRTLFDKSASPLVVYVNGRHFQINPTWELNVGKFMWVNLGNYSSEEGSIVLSIRSDGPNILNVVALVNTQNLERSISSLYNLTNIMYFLNAKTEFSTRNTDSYATFHTVSGGGFLIYVNSTRLNQINIDGSLVHLEKIGKYGLGSVVLRPGNHSIWVNGMPVDILLIPDHILGQFRRSSNQLDIIGTKISGLQFRSYSIVAQGSSSGIIIFPEQFYSVYKIDISPNSPVQSFPANYVSFGVLISNISGPVKLDLSDQRAPLQAFSNYFLLAMLLVSSLLTLMPSLYSLKNRCKKLG